MNPCQEGYNDGLEGVHDNPYPVGSPDYDDYEDGWWEGDTERYVSEDFFS